MNRVKKTILGSVFCLLFSLGAVHGQSLTVSGITNPAAANGTYLQIADLFGYKAWKHATLEYYIYNDEYTNRYWNIDTDTIDDNDVLFFYQSEAPSPTGLDYGASVSSPYTFGEGNPDVQTLSVTVTFSDGATYAPGDATAGTNNNGFGRFRLQAGAAGATLQSATVLPAGVRSGVSNLKLWSSANDVFNAGDDTLLDDETAVAGASVTFTGFSAPITTSGTYFFITGDLSLSAGGSLALSIQNNAALSIQDGTLAGSISNAALSSGPVSIAGTGPEISVEGNGVEIADGDTTPAAADDTYFGNVDLASGVTRVFTIKNTGWAQLNISGVTVDHAAFSIVNPPAASVAVGGSTAFTVAFDPAAIGPATATVFVTNDDANENPYTFAIQGNGTSTAGLYLNANDFVSLGSFNPAGDVSVDMTTLEMSGGFSGTGVETNGILVFAFDQFNLASGRSIDFSGVTNSGLKIAFLSKSNMTLAGNIHANAAAYQPGPGGHKGGQTSAEDGGGPGGGIADPDADNGAGGGGFGGSGGAAGYGAPGGSSYGDLSTALEGGSGGARSEFSTPAGGHGGGGGGALELGALQTLTVQAGTDIEARGAAGFNAANSGEDGDGGGSGGAILMHAETIVIASGAAVNAAGGKGGDGGSGSGGAGGGGGGGRIRIACHPNGAAGSSNNGTVSVAGGAGGADAGNPGTAGSIGTADWVQDARVPIAGPEINLTRNGLDFPDNGNVDFGSQVSGVYTDFSITIENPGTMDLTLTTPLAVGGLDADQFSIQQQPAASIASGASTVFIVRFAPTGAGAKTATLAIANNDIDENPYDLTLTGLGTKPEIEVRGNGLEIVDGDDSPSLADYTDFGEVNVSGVTLTRIFYIHNTGSAGLNLTGDPRVVLTGSAGFTVLDQPAASVPANGSTWFTVQFNPAVAGLRTATVSIANDDLDENPYTFTIQGTGVTPEIALRGNGVAIANGDIFPSVADHTDFESILVSGATRVRTFEILNTGSTDLNLTGTPRVSLSGSADFMVTSQPTASIAPNGSSSFTIQFNPSTTGTLSATVSIANDDDDENPYTFAVQGTGLAPEIEVRGNAVEIIEGDNSPALADHTDFGGVNISGANLTRIFYIYNTGSADLNLTGTTPVVLTGSADFLVVSQPATPLAAGASAAFSIRFDPDTVGLAAALVTIANDDGDENPYTFAIQGTGTTPEIALRGNGVEIISGATTVSVDDYTDFETVNVSGVTKVRIFYIHNTGSAGLNLTGTTPVVLTGAADFTILDQPAASIVPNGSTWFSVQFDPVTVGLATATVTIANDDDNENPYTFTIQGTGTTPEIALRGNDVEIVDGDDSPSLADFTDFGELNVSGATLVRTFYIRNTGSAGLNLTGDPLVALTGAADFTVLDQPAASIVSHGATWFTVQFNPDVAGLRTATVSIANDDLDENPYTFTIQGTGITPEIVVRGNGVEIVNNDDTPSLADHTDFGTVDISGATRIRTFYIGNTGTAGLNLTGTTVVVLTGSAGFTVLSQPATPLASGVSSSFTIQFDPASTGRHAATVTIANDDNDENPYTFTISGSGDKPGNGGGGGGGGGGGCFVKTVSLSPYSKTGLFVLCLFMAGVVGMGRKRIKAKR